MEVLERILILGSPPPSTIYALQPKHLDMACKRGYMGLVQYLFTLGLPLTQRSFDLAVKSGNTKLVEWLLSIVKEGPCV